MPFNFRRNKTGADISPELGGRETPKEKLKPYLQTGEWSE
jgi:hypothetical protein